MASKIRIVLWKMWVSVNYINVFIIKLCEKKSVLNFWLNMFPFILDHYFWNISWTKKISK